VTASQLPLSEESFSGALSLIDEEVLMGEGEVVVDPGCGIAFT